MGVAGRPMAAAAAALLLLPMSVEVVDCPDALLEALVSRCQVRFPKPPLGLALPSLK